MRHGGTGDRALHYQTPIYTDEKLWLGTHAGPVAGTIRTPAQSWLTLQSLVAPQPKALSQNSEP